MGRQQTGMCFTEEAFELRDNTKVGDTIKFKCDKWEDSDKTIKGEVLAKYERVFVLSDGHVYSWNDYLIGKEM